MATKQKNAPPKPTGEVLVRIQHDRESSLREFFYPLEATPSTNWTGEQNQEEIQRRAGLLGMSHPRTLSFLDGSCSARGVLIMALCGVDTRQGGWVEIHHGDRCVAAHPRELARERGAEWVGNLGQEREEVSE